jgi:XTP/dITP diphosphohydrolase
MMRVLLATTNKGKLVELQAVLEDLDIELVSLELFPGLPDAVEDGTTFAENARKKAFHFAGLTGLPAIADDSGLMVDALDGRPGVYSARLAPNDEERNRAVLRFLRKAGPNAPRGAQFVCAICGVFGEGRFIETEGLVRGEITLEPRGQGGFGYDPIFLYPPAGLTFGEMDPAAKNQVSHRAVALERFKRRLEAGIEADR